MTLLITGVSGQLGSVLLRAAVRLGKPAFGVASPSGPEPFDGQFSRVDITDAPALSELVARVRPSAVVHAAALSTVLGARSDPERARRVNAVATGALAAAADRAGARFVYVSTDMVFDGERAPYDEAAAPAPVSVYGRSKLGGEIAARVHPGALVVRVPLLYGIPAVARPSTFREQCNALVQRRPLTLFHDEHRTPLSLEDAALALIRTAESDQTGVLHIAGPERLSRLEMGHILADALGVERPLIESASRLSISAPEPRPADLSLQSKRYALVFGSPPGRPMRRALAALLAD
jgi:dTDP-4-dehydrorhamnose reductase